jgi:hypothetical protein
VDLGDPDPTHYFDLVSETEEIDRQRSSNENRMKNSVFIILLVSICSTAAAQIVVGSNTSLAVGTNQPILVQCSGALINHSSFDFSETDLRISLNGPVTQISGNWSLTRLQLNADAGSLITLDGNLTISETLHLISGIIQLLDGKILYTGSPANLVASAEGNSYVDGPFFQTGNGNRQFPIGTPTSYAPVRFPDSKSTGEIGVQAFDGDSQLTPDNIEVLDVNSGRYWRITSSELAQINSIVNLSTLGVAIPADGGPTIIQGEDLGSAAVNLKASSVNDDNITSLNPVTAPILAIGKQEEINVKIHDLITPFKVDNTNDRLYIENIERFTTRKVTLLDRWGKVIEEWGDEYTNEMEYDFTKLSPGNYICVAEFGNEGSGTTKISQMVTVLKTNVAVRN